MHEFHPHHPRGGQPYARPARRPAGHLAHPQSARSPSRSRAPRRSHGLGLAICKGLVEAHGRRIRARSAAPGRATTFTSTVPVAGMPAAAATDRAAARRRPPTAASCRASSWWTTTRACYASSATRSLRPPSPARDGRAGRVGAHHPYREAATGPPRPAAARRRRHLADAAGPGARRPARHLHLRLPRRDRRTSARGGRSRLHRQALVADRAGGPGAAAAQKARRARALRARVAPPSTTPSVGRGLGPSRSTLPPPSTSCCACSRSTRGPVVTPRDAAAPRLGPPRECPCEPSPQLRQQPPAQCPGQPGQPRLHLQPAPRRLPHSRNRPAAEYAALPASALPQLAASACHPTVSPIWSVAFSTRRHRCTPRPRAALISPEQPIPDQSDAILYRSRQEVGVHKQRRRQSSGSPPVDYGGLPVPRDLEPPNDATSVAVSVVAQRLPARRSEPQRSSRLQAIGKTARRYRLPTRDLRRDLLTTMPDIARQADGYVLNVAEARRATLLDAWAAGTAVAESVTNFSHRRSHPLLCFVSFLDGSITHLAEGRLGWPAGTNLRRLNLLRLTELRTPVRYAAILEILPLRFRPHVETRFADGGLLPPGSFGAVVDAVRSLLPETHRLLERFSESRRRLIRNLSSEAHTALAYQKETVATALTLAGMERNDLQDWRPRREDGQVRSFLDGLGEAYLREEQMIFNDLGTFPGLHAVRRTQHAAAVFANDRVSLTVVMAHRLSLEQQLGADLIYRNETYGSFVMVQYKAMEYEAGTTARFRLPNDQLESELTRMEQLWAQFGSCPPGTDLDGFRLKENPFFLKLCPRIVFDPDDAGLVRGMYLPLEYWRRLERSPGIEGARAGKAVTFDSAKRHFDNTTFAQLVAGGWIGTTARQTAILDGVIAEILERGRTVTIAIKRDLDAADGAIQPDADQVT